MKLFFRVDRWVNYYFFIQNLAEWHPSNRKSNNVFWDRVAGFSSGEKRLMLEFCSVQRRHGFGNDFLGTPFFSDQDPLSTLRARLSSSDYEVVEKVFKAYERAFSFLYQEDERLLLFWKALFEDEVKINQAHEAIQETLQILYGAKILPDSVEIFLAMSAPSSFSLGGGSVWNGKWLLLEVSRLEQTMIAHVMSVMWHELIHLVFEKYCAPIVSSNSLVGSQKAIGEITATLLFPRGLFAKWYFGVADPPDEYYKGIGNHEQIRRLYVVIDRYVQSSRGFDGEYVSLVQNILKKSPTLMPHGV